MNSLSELIKNCREEKVSINDIGEYLFSHPQALNDQDDKGYTPLMYATSCSSSVIPLLIQARADVNHTDRAGDTALMHSIGNNNLPAMKLLLEARADLYENHKGVTPLNAAISLARINCLAVLLDKYDDINQNNRLGFPPVIYATNPAIVEMLIEHRADVNKFDATNNINAAFIAIKNNLLSFTVMEEHIDYAAKNRIGKTPLHIACETPSFTEFGRVLARSDINCRDIYSNTPLLLALKNRNNAAISAIISTISTTISSGNSENSILDAADCWGMTPLHYAVKTMNLPLVSYLLEKGCDPNSTMYDGQQPLFSAVMRDVLCESEPIVDVVKLLIEHGANTSSTYKGRTFRESARNISDTVWRTLIDIELDNRYCIIS